MGYSWLDLSIMGSQNDLQDQGTLNGWKDIASYLGKSVRAVQRWERDFGLPVQRIKTPTGQVVYAFRAEIDAWRLALRERSAAEVAQGEAVATPTDQNTVTPDVAQAAGNASPAPEPPPSRPRHRRLVRAAAVLGTSAVIAVSAVVLTSKAGTLSRKATKYEVSGTSLVALSNDRRTVWSHDFGWQSEKLQNVAPVFTPTVAVDLEGDGQQEVLAVIRAPGAHGEPWRDSVFCFSDVGALLWSYTPNLKLAYEGRAFEGPWRYYTVAASAGPGRQRAWVSFGHHTWWPSFVIELDAGGNATPRYFQSGAVYGLAHWSTGAREYLVATGVNNEYARASIAVLNVDGAATSPQHAGTGFHCDSCPPDGPEFFAALPRTELNRVSGFSYNSAGSPSPNGADLTIYAYEFGLGLAPSVVYSLRNDFTFQDIGLSDGYAEKHRQLQAEGKITHAFTACPDRRDPLALLTWRRTPGWRESSVAISLPPQPAR